MPLTSEWPYPYIKEELASFTAGKTEWPTRMQFRTAGKQALYMAIQRSGTRERLAADLGLRLPPSTNVTGPRRWTDEAVRPALDSLLAGRTPRPKRREFEEAGFAGLSQTLQRQGTRDE